MADLRQLSDEEIIRHLPDEVLLQHIQGTGVSSTSGGLPSYEQSRLQAEQQISERPSAIQYLRQVAQQPQLAQQHPFRTAFSAIGAPFEAGESIPANIGLALQRGNLSQLPQQLLQGVTGERPAQMGDIYRASGVPAIQAMAAPAGLLMTGGTRSLAQTGATAKLPTAIANIVRRTTTMPAELSKQVLGFPARVTGKISKQVIEKAGRMVDPLTEFPARKTLEIRQGLIGSFRKLNDWYGDQIEKLSKDLKGVLPTQQLADILKRRLQEVGVLDQMGNPIPNQLDKITRAEREIFQTYEDLAKSLSPTADFKDVLSRLRHLKKVIRQTARQRNVPINADERIISGVVHDIATFIEPNNTSLADINKQYAIQRQMFDGANKIFKVFKGEYDTKAGERAIGQFHTLDQGTRKLLSDVEQTTGVKFIEKAKAYAAAKQVLSGFQTTPIIGGALRIGSGVGKLTGQGIPFALQKTGDLPGQIQAAFLREMMKVLERSE